MGLYWKAAIASSAWSALPFATRCVATLAAVAERPAAHVEADLGSADVLGTELCVAFACDRGQRLARLDRREQAHHERVAIGEATSLCLWATRRSTM